MRRIAATTVVTLALSLGGCLDLVKPSQPAPSDVNAEQGANYLKKAPVKSDAGAEAADAVESALAWSEKYAAAVEKMAKAQEDRRELEDRHQKTQAQTAKLQAELAECQKELAQANAVLVELQQQLEKWKSNVLGFREEMRQAQQAQLEALARVLKLLGGELPEPSRSSTGGTPPSEASTRPANTEGPAVSKVEK